MNEDERICKVGMASSDWWEVTKPLQLPNSDLWRFLLSLPTKIYMSAENTFISKHATLSPNV